MKRESLDTYDILPQEMIDYLANYGRHFNKKLLMFALKQMKCKHSSTGELKRIKAIIKEDVDKLLEVYNVQLENNQLYDYVYVANMGKAGFLGKSIPDEQHLAQYIKDVIDDDDGYEGIVFNRWLSDMRRKGIAIDWEEML